MANGKVGRDERNGRADARLAIRGMLLACLGAAFIACEDKGTEVVAPFWAKAQVSGFTDPGITGTVTFSAGPGGEGILVQGKIRGLAYGTVYGVHVHEKGSCSAPDSSGGHFRADAETHGNPFDEIGIHHAGDLPGLQVDSSGVGHFDLLTGAMTLTPGPLSPVGRAVIIHAGPDDYKTQPTGNSGARIACGVILAN